MSKVFKSIAITIIAGMLPAVNLYCKIVDIAILESPKFQYIIAIYDLVKVLRILYGIDEEKSGLLLLNLRKIMKGE